MVRAAFVVVLLGLQLVAGNDNTWRQINAYGKQKLRSTVTRSGRTALRATTGPRSLRLAGRTAVQGITNNVADPDRVKQAMQAEGVSSSVTVARAPTHTVAVSTRIVSGTSEPVSIPDSTKLQSQLSTDLGTEVASAFQPVVSPLLWGIILLSSCWTSLLR
eukprot:TRINITY_DN7477_c0_g1_i1.p1 TRINITY_DN7477_c0_g1~~TRINITY_DN7477_c0_g1_i1.p1  ORF type:complete len:161 (+),score=9.84 TRINITY_DN7477_c0_g1_i1:102-584(+)